MDLAVHMKNKETGEERIKKTQGKNASMGNWHCKDFYYGSEWIWTGTEPWKNVADSVKHIGRGYYVREVNDLKATTYINELPSNIQAQIRKEVENSLRNVISLSSDKIREETEIAMGGRLCDLEDTINIKKIMDTANKSISRVKGGKSR